MEETATTKSPAIKMDTITKAAKEKKREQEYYRNQFKSKLVMPNLLARSPLYSIGATESQGLKYKEKSPATEREQTNSHQRRKWKAKHQPRQQSPCAFWEVASYKIECTRTELDHGHRHRWIQFPQAWQ